MQLKCLPTWHFLLSWITTFAPILFKLFVQRRILSLQSLTEVHLPFTATFLNDRQKTYALERMWKKSDALFCIVKSSLNWLIIISNQWHSVRKCVKFHFPFQIAQSTTKFYLKKFIGLINQNNLLNCCRIMRLACLNKNQTEFRKKA